MNLNMVIQSNKLISICSTINYENSSFYHLYLKNGNILTVHLTFYRKIILFANILCNLNDPNGNINFKNGSLII